MKFKVTMKTPDALDYALEDLEYQLSEKLPADTVQIKLNEAETFAKKYMEYGEYIHVEFDTVAQTARVV